MTKSVMVAVAVSALIASLTTIVVIKSTQTAPATENGTAPGIQEQREQRVIPAGAAAMDVDSLGVHSRPDGESSSMVAGGDILAQMQAESAALDRQFRAQPRDAKWASKTEQTLRETMTAEVMVMTEIEPSDLTYSCRTDLCLVKGEFSKHGDAEDWGIMLVTASGDTFVNAKPMIRALPNGKTELQLYAARR